MLRTNLEENSLGDLQKLVDGRVPESQTLEFKRDNYRLDNPNVDDKHRQQKELLKDASCFANSEGGDLIIGIEEHNGAAAAITGVQTDNPDGVKRQLIAIIRNGTDPKLSFGVHTIHVRDDRHVFVIRVRRSGHAPHRVVYRGEQCGFWARNSGGVHELDAGEIASLSRQSKSLQHRIEEFRSNRLNAIQNGNTPVTLSESAKIVVHLVPENAFVDFQIGQDDLTYFAINMPMLHPTGGWTHEHNLDGMVTYDRDKGIPTSGYVQLYRNGIIESVADDVTFFHPNDVAMQHRLFKSDYLNAIPSRMRSYLSLLQAIETGPPIWFYMSFVGLSGVEVLPRDWTGRVGRQIREELILTPGQEIEDLSADVKAILKPGFDKLWNAAGYPKSPD